jgi:hypothetical protein
VLVVQLLLILALLSLAGAIRGRWWSLALPAAVVVFGAALYLAGDPPPPGGGDGDPMRLTGTGLLVWGTAWLGVMLLVRASRSWFRRRPAATSERQ